MGQSSWRLSYLDAVGKLREFSRKPCTETDSKRLKAVGRESDNTSPRRWYQMSVTSTRRPPELGSAETPRPQGGVAEGLAKSCMTRSGKPASKGQRGPKGSAGGLVPLSRPCLSPGPGLLHCSARRCPHSQPKQLPLPSGFRPGFPVQTRGADVFR